MKLSDLKDDDFELVDQEQEIDYQQPTIQSQEISPIESFGRSALKSVPLAGSFADEAEAGIKAAVNSSSIEDFLREYEAQKQDVRNIYKESEQQNPNASLLGMGAGTLASFALPGGALLKAASLPSKIAVAAGSGALTGIGESEADLLSPEMAKDALSGAAIGGTIQGGIGAIGKAFDSAKKYRGIRDLAKNYELGKEGIDTRSMPGSEKASKNLYDIANELNEQVAQGAKTTGKTLENVLEKSNTPEQLQKNTETAKNILSYLNSKINESGSFADKQVLKLLRKEARTQLGLKQSRSAETKELFKLIPDEIREQLGLEADVITRQVKSEDLKNLVDKISKKSYLTENQSKSLSNEVQKYSTEIAKLSKEALNEIPGLSQANAQYAPFKRYGDVFGKAQKGDLGSELDQSTKLVNFFKGLGSGKELTREESQRTLTALLDEFSKTKDLSAPKIKSILNKAPELADLQRLAEKNQKPIGGLEGFITKAFSPGANKIGSMINQIENKTPEKILNNFGIDGKLSSILPETTAVKLLNNSNKNNVVSDANNVTQQDLINIHNSLDNSVEGTRLKQEIATLQSSDPTRRSVLLFKLMQNPKFREAMNK